MSQEQVLHEAVGEMLTPRFLQENTRFASREALFAGAGIPLDLDDSELAGRLHSEAFASFLVHNTPFASFEALLAKAGDAWVSRSLFGEEVDMEAVRDEPESSASDHASETR